MKSFINPVNLVKEIGIHQGQVVAEFGSGSGEISLNVARLVGASGQVIAVDVRKSTLESLESRAKIEGLQNIRLIHVNLESPNGSGLQEDSVDLVVVANVLFQSPDKASIIKEAMRVLKKGAMLVVVDWRPDVIGAFGPKAEQRVSPQLVIGLAERQPEEQWIVREQRKDLHARR